MGRLSSELVVSAQDRASGPLRGLRNLMSGFRRDSVAFNNTILGPGFGQFRNIFAATGAYFGLRETFRSTIGASMAFEEKFAEVRKVVEGSPAEVARLRSEIVGLSKRLPVAAEGLSDIMSAAGQAGISLKDLPKFTEFTAKAAVAFDMSEAETGDRFAKLRNVFSLDQTGLEELANAANLLSNNMASSGDEITDFVNRAAGSASTLRLLPRQLAAVGSAMASAGIAPETAARGLSAFTNKIVAGGPKVNRAFKTIGLSFKEWRKVQAKNGPEALVQLFDAASKKGEKGLRALQDLVGQDFSDDFSKIVANPDLLRQAFEAVADPAKVANSVQAEFINKSDTAAKKIQLLKNNVSALGIAAGDLVAPAIGNWAKDLADTLGTLNQRVTVFDTIKAKVDGLMKGLGFEGAGEVAGIWAGLRDGLFGRIEQYDKDTQQMHAASIRWREIGTNIRDGIEALKGGGMSGATNLIAGDLKSLRSALSFETIAMLGLGAVALKGVARATVGLAFGRFARVGMMAYGLSALADGGEKMSVVDWAAIGIGLTAFSGGVSTLATSLKLLAPFAGLLGIMGAIKEYGPKVADNKREPKKGEPLDWIRNLTGVDPLDSREERNRKLSARRRAEEMSVRRKDDDAFSGFSKAERDAWFAKPAERPLQAEVMNENLTPGTGWEKLRQEFKELKGSLTPDVPSAAPTRREIIVPTGDWRAKPYEAPRTRGGVSDIRPMPSGPVTLDTSQAETQAEQLANQLRNSLQIEGRADLDSSSLDVALQKAQRLLSLLRQAGQASASMRFSRGIDASGVQSDMEYSVP